MLVVVGFLALLFLVSFLLGSVPWGVIISRVFYHTDVRDHGSGNIGTTNAMRTMGKVGGSAVFLLDFGKGVLSGLIAVFIAGCIVVDAAAAQQFCTATAITGPTPDASAVQVRVLQVCLSIAFLGCVLGHIFSPWLGFKGGKGIAVAIGCLFSTFGLVGFALELLIFIVLVAATKYVSVGSIAAAVACPFFALFFFLGNWVAIVACLIAAVTVIWAHRENIARLRAGNENKIGSKKKASQE